MSFFSQIIEDFVNSIPGVPRMIPVLSVDMGMLANVANHPQIFYVMEVCYAIRESQCGSSGPPRFEHR
jgi:hypothetical protein